MELKKFDSKEQMSLAAAAYTKTLIAAAAIKTGFFSLALSGGSSPVRFYELLAEEDIDWTMVNIFLVDERKVPGDHKFSNFRMIKKALLSGIKIPESNIFCLKTGIQSSAECAEEYEKRIRNVFGVKFPVFDLIVLGVGPDGHTASLFPEKDHTLDQDRLFISTIAPAQFDVTERLTMTLSLINGAKQRLFVIAGKGKNEMIQRILDGDSSIPSGLVNSDSTVFFNNS